MIIHLIVMFLLSVGITLILTQKHIIALLIGIELIFNSAILNLVNIAQIYDKYEGYLLAIVGFVIALIEAVIIFVFVYKIKNNKTHNI